MPVDPEGITPDLLFRPFRCLATDPIGMEFLLEEEEDEDVKRQLKAQILVTAAEVYEALAKGAFAAGRIYSGE